MRATVITVLLLAGSTAPAWSGVPDPTNSIVPGFIDVVGTDGGVPDPAGTFTVTVRDFANNPCAGAVVTLRFGDCTDLRLANVQAPGATLSCDGATLAVTADDSGAATFTVVGAGTTDFCTMPSPPGIPPGPGLGCVRVCADGIELGTTTAVQVDFDGAAAGDGVNVIDMEILKRAVAAISLGAAYKGRYDLSHDGTVNAMDLSHLVSRYLRPGIATGSGSRDGSNGAGFCAAPTTPPATCP
jgi:hypothetical protein